MNLTHGHARHFRHTKAYSSWHQMKARCQNSNNPGFAEYGGRGITVCERWQTFENFYADMGEPPPGCTLDRYPDMNGNYEPSNCRWATVKEQNNNTRGNKRLTFRGETKTLAEWADRLGIKSNTILYRLRRGVSVEDALSAQVNKKVKFRPARTHCPHGHPYDEENTFRQRDGSRGCRECSRVSSREYQRRKARAKRDLSV